MQETNIPYCDSTVSPTSGCQGCELWNPRKGIHQCYAGLLQEKRLCRALPNLYAPDFTEVRLIPGRMAKAARWTSLQGQDRAGKPWLDGHKRLIFAGDMSDMLCKDVSFEYLFQEVICTALAHPGNRHTYLWLSKRANRMVEFYGWLHGHGIGWPRNVIIGTSVTSQATLARAAKLCELPSRFIISYEPALEAVNWEHLPKGKVAQIIFGGRSGVGSAAAPDSWARNTLAWCRNNNATFFWKQRGGEGDKGADLSNAPLDLRIREMPVGLLTP